MDNYDPRKFKECAQQKKTGGYTATASASTGSSASGDKTPATGSVFIETDPDKIDHLEQTSRLSVANCLWPLVRNIINKANKDMMQFLTLHFLVKEFHLMSKAFPTDSSTPEELIKRLKLVLKKSDDELFKNETKFVRDRRIRGGQAD